MFFVGRGGGDHGGGEFKATQRELATQDSQTLEL